MSDSDNEYYGKCCFCDCPCNPASQACGSCARGLNTFYLDYPKTMEKISNKYSDETDTMDIVGGICNECGKDCKTNESICESC